MKRCGKCKVEKDVGEFHGDKHSADGLQGRCKSCVRVRNAEYGAANREYFIKKGKEKYEKEKANDPDFNKKRYAANAETFKEASREFRASPRGAMYALFAAAKSRAHGKGREVTITLEDVLSLYERSGGLCSLTGLPFDLTPPDRRRERFYRPLAPSLDRVDSDKGYTPDNVRLVLTCINLALNRFGEEFMAPVLAAFLTRRGYAVTPPS
jgi:hypothetical protein